MEDCLLWGEPHAGAGEEGEKSLPEEEGEAETRCDEPTMTSIPLPHPSAVRVNMWLCRAQLPMRVNEEQTEKKFVSFIAPNTFASEMCSIPFFFSSFSTVSLLQMPAATDKMLLWVLLVSQSSAKWYLKNYLHKRFCL